MGLTKVCVPLSVGEVRTCMQSHQALSQRDSRVGDLWEVGVRSQK